MKAINHTDFEANISGAIDDVRGGSILCVNYKDRGKVIVLEEQQFRAYDDALKTVMAVADMDDDTYKAILRAAKKAGVKGSYGRDV
ncbi:MAG: hypothetical protein FWB91_00385 [Defluviitaleaceae bacterium]|nr:hypothetical protein [Defluviitaleaceae bacterium]